MGSSLLTGTLHWSGAQTRLWPLNQAVALFFHPTLCDLTLSCAETDEIDIPDTYRGCTCLRQLTLIECSISMATLESLLSLPSTLQSLDITSRRSLPRRMEKVSLISLVRILVVHQPKLESLTYSNALDLGNNDQIEGSGINASSLSKLKYLALPYEGGRRSHQQMSSLMECISPNEGFISLETVLIGLDWRNGKASTVLSDHPRLGLQKFKCPHLRTLVIDISISEVVAERKDSRNKWTSFCEAVKKLFPEKEKEKESKVRIVLQETIHYHYVTPYLFGEKAPERKTIGVFSADGVPAS